MGFFEKLKEGLTKTKNAIFKQVNDIFKHFVKVDEEMLEELEETLIAADVGIAATEEIIDTLREKIKDEHISDPQDAKKALMDILVDMIGEGEPLNLDTRPAVILVIGVNGVGKTTSVAKIAHCLKDEGKKVLLCAADTFRAGAIEQLQIWGDRAGIEVIKHAEGSDPAAVVFDAANAAKAKGADVLIIDTAGRLHNKKNLMNELAKIDRVIERELPGSAKETLLVLDAVTGQNAVNQAQEFKTASDITGIVLTKLDGTAKGGIAFSIKKVLGIPVKYIGVGEKLDDLQDFSARDFVNALFEE
ncbi:MAG: signal recognition particle-docking protein FtsY [Ruminococcaceae bacterium]|nr:signal recognition particle-docking protein FtsY [Oscillospiraceae bacterium]